MTHRIRIQTNDFLANQIPVIQEDHFGGIVGKWELFDIINESKIGTLVQYFGNYYRVFHEKRINYRMEWEEITVQSMTSTYTLSPINEIIS